MSKIESEWSQIVEELGPGLYRYFLGSFAPPAAADLVQETLIRLLRKDRDRQFDPKKGTLKNLAFGIARFVRLESLKKNPDFELVEDESSLEKFPEISERVSDPVSHLRWAIGQLKGVEQELILRMIDDESTLEQMSEEFEIPLGTVKSHIHRAKIKLRELMEVNP